MSLSAHDLLYSNSHHSNDDEQNLASIDELQQLLCHLLKYTETEFLLKKREPIQSQDLIQAFYRQAKELREGKPLAYIIGQAPFMSHTYLIQPGVLIPRHDTECLVEHSIRLLHTLKKDYSSIVGVECGVGSGIISIECALAHPTTHFHAWDISQKALDIAKHNATRLGASNITFHHGNFFDGIQDILKKHPNSLPFIISNPPYIETDTIQTLEDSVKNYEPHLALDGGTNGLEFYDAFFSLIQSIPSVLLCEFGYNQKNALQALARKYELYTIEFFQDLSQNDRYFIARTID